MLLRPCVHPCTRVASPWRQLLYLRENAREFIANNGVRVLCDMLTLAHLHVQRAQTPLQVRLRFVPPACRASPAHRAVSATRECRR